MRRNIQTNTSAGQLKWVILLLVVAVILPTVCLLWFMTQAVDNVRMATRQKLIDLYAEKLETAAAEIDTLWRERITLIENSAADMAAPANFRAFALSYGENSQTAGALVTYDQSGNLLYPVAHSNEPEPNLPEEFERAWELEFVHGDFQEAAKAYGAVADSTEDDYVRRRAMLAQARCEIGRGRLSRARLFCREAIHPHPADQVISMTTASLTVRAMVMIADLERRENPSNSADLANLIGVATSYKKMFLSSEFSPPMDSATRIFALKKAIEMAERSPLANEFEESQQLNKARWLLAAEQLAADVIEPYPTTAAFVEWRPNGVYRMNVPGDMYGLYLKTADRTFLLLRTGDDMKKDLAAVDSAFAGSDVAYEATDDTGSLLAGQKPLAGTPFLEASLGRHLPNLQVRLYFKDADVFDRVARRQVTTYIWAGVLVIVLILAVGGFAGRVVSRQMRLNRLKNDFIATVSHELKTPLASMRVLADTLLEGNYKDRRQATEYLELICKENRRLTGLIDNFLTFSRMERNKQAFEFEPTSPAEIAHAAADAVRTKFDRAECRLELHIAEDLPRVSADKDAMVTVLVNLLDNACKYSRDDKRIAMKAFGEDASVCFSVSDNGIGISRKAVKRIFKRFYQVDRTLARHAEGCGLGLSIAKFIVDAHKGEISVATNPEQGSTFTVKLPAAD